MAFWYSSSEKPAVVLDLGSSYLKCGFAGDSSPRAIVPSPVRDLLRATAPPTVAGLTRFTRHFSRVLLQLAAYTLRCRDGTAQPLTREGWLDVIAPLMQHIYFSVLRTKPDERRVIIIEDLVANTLMRSAIAHVLFDLLNVPSAAFAPSLVLALSTTGVGSGIVVDIGLAETRVLPIVHGSPVSRAFQTLPVGAATVRARMETPTFSAAMAEEALAQRGCVAPRRPARSGAAGDGAADGDAERSAVAEGSAAAAGRALEVLWELDEEECSVATSVLDALLLCSADVRCRAAQNIVLVGGLAVLPGIDARLRAEIVDRCAELPRFHSLLPLRERFGFFAEAELGGRTLFPASTRAWVGGSLLGKLTTFGGASYQSRSKSPIALTGMLSVDRKQYLARGLPDPMSVVDAAALAELEEAEADAAAAALQGVAAATDKQANVDE